MKFFVKRVFLLLALSFVLQACRFNAPEPPPTISVKNTQKSVVKIFSTLQNVDYSEPWKPGSTVSREGCGAILPGGHILTNAHLVDKANYIEVQKFGETKRYVAKVEKIGEDLDIALLSVEDKEFIPGTEPIEFGGLPAPGEKVIIQGGDELSKKEDTISGLKLVWSWEGSTYVPALVTLLEMDEKVLGSPVFKNSKFIGLSFAGWDDDKKIGFVIPATLVQMFLKAVGGGQDYQGLSDLGIETQDLVSPELRSYYRLPADKTGVVVTEVLYGGASTGLLKEGDIITAIGGHSVDNEGYAFLEKLGRVPIDYIISLSLPGESMDVDIYRDGQPMKLTVLLKTEPKLVFCQPANRHPTYYMIAGFVFVPLTSNYIWMNWNTVRPELRSLSNHGQQSPEEKQAVLISNVLPADINKGYGYFSNILVKRVNGQSITEMKDLIKAFEHPHGKYDVIEFDDHAWTGSIVVFDAKKEKKATKEIMKKLNIPSDRSDDLK